METQDFVAQVEKHLRKPNALIAVSQGDYKLAKRNASHNKFNWTIDEVITESGSVDAFFNSLTSKGFTDGAVLSLRMQRGSSTHLVGNIELKFSQQAQTPSIPPATQPTEAPVQQPALQPAMAAPQAPVIPNANMAMGYTQVPQYDLIELKVQQMRYHDLVKELDKAKSEREQAQSELRMEKERSFSLERKLETFEDKAELKLERELNNKKGFFDSDTGKEVVTALAGNLPAIMAALKPQQAAQIGGMANPIANLSPAKQQFVQQLAQYPEPIIPFLQQVAEHALSDDEFYNYVNAALEQMNTQNPDENA